jgi:hypothetical protein
LNSPPGEHRQARENFVHGNPERGFHRRQKFDTSCDEHHANGGKKPGTAIATAMRGRMSAAE